MHYIIVLKLSDALYHCFDLVGNKKSLFGDRRLRRSLVWLPVGFSHGVSYRVSHEVSYGLSYGVYV